jgi:hypothetical protein
MWYRFLSAALILLVFASCEDSMVLKSEKKMEADLQGTWRKDFQGRNMYFKHCPVTGDSTYYNEYWTFKDNVVYMTFELENPVDCDHGTPDLNYSDAIDTGTVTGFNVDTRILDAFLKFQLISGGGDSANPFVDKWEFVTLDNDVLYLATDNPNGTSVLQYEFSKVK